MRLQNGGGHMGVYLDPSAVKFEMALRSEIYVDKTGMLSFLNSVVNTEQRFLAVSRPRRFGKTMAANMICAYYNRAVDTRKMFSAYRIAEKDHWDEYLNAFHVIRINMVDFVSETEGVVECLQLLQERVLAELKAQYPDIAESAGRKLSFFLDDAFNRTKDQFVIVIDEWDCVFRQFREDMEGQKKYLEFLRDLLKDKVYISLAYITGILPIKKYGQHSALNMFTEYSMLAPQQLAEYVGFTDEEVRNLCSSYGRSYEDIRAWYDGYDLYGVVPSGETKAEEYQIYSPYSVVQAVISGQIKDYWNATETYEALSVHINRNFSCLKDMVMLLMQGSHIPVNTRKYQNDMSSLSSADDVLTLLIHLGYLAYDSSRSEVYIPNREVLDEYRNTINGDHGWERLYAVLNQSQKLLEATWAGDADTVSALLEKAHMKAGNQTCSSEAALSYAIRLAYFNAEQYDTLIPEMQAGKGYADLVYIPSKEYPDKPAMLVELKYDEDADTAISQIHRQQYPSSLEKYQGNLLLIGISCSRSISHEKAEFKHHSCVIEHA